MHWCRVIINRIGDQIRTQINRLECNGDNEIDTVFGHRACLLKPSVFNNLLLIRREPSL